MIIAGSIDEMFELQNPIIERLAIVHSCKPEQLPADARQVLALAPSSELFKDYRAAVRCGSFTSEWFENVYVPRFLQDISKNQEAIFWLVNLCQNSFEHDVFIGCFCQNPRLCHRTIVSNILYGMGADICGYDDRWEYHYNTFNKIRVCR